MIRVLRLSVLLTAAALAAACSGESDETGADPPAPTTAAVTEPAPTTTETEAEPPPRPDGPLKRLVAAARGDDARAMWELLSGPTRERLGPSFARFRRGAAADLRQALGSFVRGRARIFLAERITEEFAVAAYGGRLTDERHASFATALRLEDGAWKLELGGPVQLQALVPDPGEIERRGTGAQLAAGIVADAAVREGGLWIDGRSVPGKSGGTDDRNVTIFSDPVERLARGPHAVVAFASTASDASALAWMFTVR
jgi:hypothetical protein